MWDVIEAGFIGNFSFSQFVMWNDIHSQTGFLSGNKLVRSLMEGAVDWDCTIPEGVDTDEAYLPVTADSSQLRAINMAAAGVSFVLHGPPGTGKSQTITAMIANALTRGKTILFVAEKMAALEVVERRLAALGIGNFCLELHSNKATKKAVLNQLKRGLELQTGDFDTEYERKIEDIRKMRRDLDSYGAALHKKRSFGKSLRELIDLYELIPEHGKEVRFGAAYAGSLTEAGLDDQRHILERVVAAGRGIGHPAGHPLSPVRQTVYTQSLRQELEPVMEAYREALRTYEEEVTAFSERLGMERPVTGEDWERVSSCVEDILAAETIPAFLMDADQVDAEFFEPVAYMEKRDALYERRDALSGRWNENFLRLDMSVFRRRFEEAGKKFFGKGKAFAALTAEIQAYASFQVLTEQIPVLLTEIEVYQQEVHAVEAAEERLSREWRMLAAGYPSGAALQEYQGLVKRQLAAAGPFLGRIRALKAAGNWEECTELAGRILADFPDLREKEARAAELLQLESGEDSGSYMEDRRELCDRILEHASAIKDWIVYRQLRQEAAAAGLEPICAAYEAGMPHEEVMEVYLKSVCKAMILSVIETEPELNRFTGIGFAERIQQFKKLDEEFMELTKEEMYHKLTQQLPTGYESVEISRELNILRRAISSNGRGISIRSLFEQIPGILPKLCPCMLMSPISAAQYLKAENNLFDVVIFDEASQLPTCKAVGVLARGRDAVIVGDPNQMPPTSFFAGNTVDEDNLDIEDLDSILDDCLALGMPQAHLQWHYRSRHESLIAFSNQEFYENQMLTFPSVNDRERRVSLVRVEGFFDRGKGRVNQAEAEAVVREILRRYMTDGLRDQRIGVVTFNISQQTLIEDLLQEEYRRDTALDAWANTGEEPLFVKNLENVQGDERDVILFSVAFGPDSEGKLSMNFGPLNKDGGWKRLNVAVSRARSEMVVFSSMRGDMIDLRRTKSRGVEALRDFLLFAERGRLQGGAMEGPRLKNQGILEHVCRELEQAGFAYQCAVGHSSFKVDIAVVNPYNPDEYLLGFMLDGDSYRQSRNTKDREVSQLGVLEGLGWEVHRIWTMDWWDNREKEIAEILRLTLDKKEEAREKSELERRKAEEEEEPGDMSGVEEAEELGTVADLEHVEEPGEAAGLEDVEEPEQVSEAEEKEQIVEAEVMESLDGQEKLEDAAEPLGAGPAWERRTAELGLETERMTENAADRMASRLACSMEDEDAVRLQSRSYCCVDYEAAVSEPVSMSPGEYALKTSMDLIVDRINQITAVEAPISYNRLLKKVLRAFDITRSSPQTIEATEKALKKAAVKLNRQNGARFYWKQDQNPEEYRLYRREAGQEDKRSPEDICQQEVKNAICGILQAEGAMEREPLTKAAIRAMGFGRSSTSLLEAVDRGLKYGKKTGEITVTEDKKLTLG